MLVHETNVHVRALRIQCIRISINCYIAILHVYTCMLTAKLHVHVHVRVSVTHFLVYFKHFSTILYVHVD